MKVHIFRINRKGTINLVIKFSSYFSFSLTKKKQKVKAKDQPPFAPQNLRRMAVRSLSPKPNALLPTYDKLISKVFYLCVLCEKLCLFAVKH
jgi:hypothetical protein